jgi:hypothetical protein
LSQLFEVTAHALRKFIGYRIAVHRDQGVASGGLTQQLLSDLLS